MRPNLITRLKEEWNNLDPVDPLRGLIADAIDALAEQPAQQQELPACISCGAAPTRYVDEGTELPGTYCDNCGPGGVPAQQQEPVARSSAYDMIDRFLQNNLNSDEDYAEYSKALDSLYTSPPASKPWVGLTDWEREKLRSEADEADAGYTQLIKATEAKLREKNA